MRSLRTAFSLVAITIAAAGVTNAQVSPKIAKQLCEYRGAEFAFRRLLKLSSTAPEPAVPDVLIGRDNTLTRPRESCPTFSPRKKVNQAVLF